MPKIKTPFIIGLTGGIGTGKSTAAKILKDMDIPVHNADEAVHAALKKGGAAVKPISRLFPEVVQDGAINRQALGHMVFGKPTKLKQLEKILHPLVQKSERAFAAAAKRTKTPMVVLEIPLLFETGAEARCDVVICMVAPRAVQKERVLKRKGMTLQKFNAIVKHQMPQAEKKRRADFMIKSAAGVRVTKQQLQLVVDFLGLHLQCR